MEGEIILLILQVCLMCDSSTECLPSVSTTEELPFCQSRISKHITPDLRALGLRLDVWISIFSPGMNKYSRR